MARPARIDRDEVLGAALALADADGVEAVTMQAVARRVGVTPMALYRHVESKRDLLDGVVERLLEEVSVPPDGADWDDQLVAMARSLRAVARRHPEVFPLLLQLPATTSAARVARDRVCTLLERAGADPAAASQLERLVSTAVLGFAASEASGRFEGQSRAQLDRDFALLLDMLRTALSARLS